jgi:hypothetical protein
MEHTMHRIASRLIVLLFVSLVAGSANAGQLEQLLPQTALGELQQSSGVVLVDLFAHW